MARIVAEKVGGRGNGTTRLPHALRLDFLSVGEMRAPYITCFEFGDEQLLIVKAGQVPPGVPKLANSIPVIVPRV